jgi:hypothetical protein
MWGTVAAHSTSRQPCIHGHGAMVQCVYQRVHYSSVGEVREDHRPAFHGHPLSCQCSSADSRSGPRANEAASRRVGHKGYFSPYSAELFPILPNKLLSPSGFRPNYWRPHRGDFERDVTQGSPQRCFGYRTHFGCPVQWKRTLYLLSVCK